jgi:hypothetical protein
MSTFLERRDFRHGYPILGFFSIQSIEQQPVLMPTSWEGGGGGGVALNQTD